MEALNPTLSLSDKTASVVFAMYLSNVHQLQINIFFQAIDKWLAVHFPLSVALATDKGQMYTFSK